MTTAQQLVQSTDRFTTPSQVLLRYIGNIATVVVAASPACHAEAVSHVATRVDARAALAAEAKEAKALAAEEAKALKDAKAEKAKALKDAKAEKAKVKAMLRLSAIFAHAAV